MDNKELYKKAIDEIHAPDELKRKTLEKIESKKPRYTYIRYATACAAFVLALILGVTLVPENNKSNLENDLFVSDSNSNKTEFADANLEDLQTFKDINELREVLEENNNSRSNTKGLITIDGFASVEESEKEGFSSAANSVSDYSTTNVQVEGVDEADIVKTDGNYIYYLDHNTIHIIKAETLEEVSTITYGMEDDSSEQFSAREFYIVNNRLVVLGDSYTYNTTTLKRASNYDDLEDVAYIDSSSYAQAIIYDITYKDNITELRKIKLDGSYINSRMIGNNLYFISNKTPMYYANATDYEILPSYIDGVKEKTYIPAENIIYFPKTNNFSYVLIAGVDISKDEEMNVESFFGAWTNKIYASENNLYLPITQNYFWNETTRNLMYKFSLNDSKVEFVAKGEFEGYLDSQFSIDEYNGFLRVATTLEYNEDSSNTLYIFDENLNEVSKLTDIAKGERIYSVRFMGKVGYIVTFEQVDPLFVVDLSDPYNPEIKGELEMPGYSSYLHPYDETHIIGIGYNVKSNGYGGVTNTNMKMAMFDVSDLNNPKEMFSVNIGDEYVYSELNYNHKALFYSKEKNLIGFPIQTWDSNYYNSKSNFTLYDIDLENGFTVHGKIDQVQHYKTEIQRAIFINNDLYTLSTRFVTKYDLNSFEKLNELDLED